MKNKFKSKVRRINVFIAFSLILPLMAFKNSTISNSEDVYEVTLNMKDLKPEKSSVMVAIYNNSESFMGKNQFKKLKIDNPGQSTVTKKITLPEGTYGIAVFQDLNGNEKLDKNFIGIPNEPYCFSNNQAGRFGPPSWEEAKVTVTKDSVLEFEF